jgi:hypothetical protein
MKKQVLFLILAMSLPLCAQTTYQLGTLSGTTFTGSATGRYPISSPYQFNCNGVPLLANGTEVGSVQILNENGTFQVHAPGIADPNQYLESKFAPDMTQFSLPNSAGPGNVVFKYQITDANNNVFHGTVTAPWVDYKSNLGWHYPRLLTTPVDGTLTIAAGPLE